MQLGEYIVAQRATVRQAAKKFGISKSTVQKDVAQRLKTIAPQLHRRVKMVLDVNEDHFDETYKKIVKTVKKTEPDVEIKEL